MRKSVRVVPGGNFGDKVHVDVDTGVVGILIVIVSLVVLVVLKRASSMARVTTASSDNVEAKAGARSKLSNSCPASKYTAVIQIGNRKLKFDITFRVQI